MNLPTTVALPLKTDEHGMIRVSGTRVTLDTLIGFYKQGETPEDLHEGFDTVPLHDIHVVIAYYLANREVIDDYLDKNRQDADRIRAEIEANYTPEQKASIERLRKLKTDRNKEKDG